MILKKASAKAVRYAIMNWHYSKSVPMVQVAYAVFNDKDEWCGVICYSIGANNNIAKPYKLNQGEVIELVRVALNGKQESTSKALSISLKLIKKDAPLVKLIVSYADTEQGHAGTIYQATNWYFTDTKTDGMDKVIFNGKVTHKKTVNSRIGTTKGLEIVKGTAKHKYIYPLDKSLIPLCKELSKQYPKNKE
jgi:hypothetical protein